MLRMNVWNLWGDVRKILIKFLNSLIMKKLIFLYLFLFPFSVFASTGLTLNWPSRVSVGETFELKALLQWSESLQISDLDITWKENFILQWTSTRNNIQIINGNTQAEAEYTFSFVAQKKGVFTLWPVTIQTWSGKIQSSPLQIEVWEQSSLNTSWWDLPHDIYWPVTPSFPFLPFFLLLCALIFWWLFYKLLSKYFSNESSQIVSKKQEIPVSTISLEQKYISLFQTLLNQSSTYTKNEFYKQVNESLRKYFEEKWLLNATTFTYDEIKKNPFFKKNLSSFSSLFAQSYSFEFREVQDTQDERKKLLWDIISTLEHL